VTETPVVNESWSWPDALDACIAAQQSHRVLYENEIVRVLEVTIEPGVREPLHTHRASSVMIVDGPAHIHYYTGDTLTFETPLDAPAERRTSWLGPEPPHSVENIDVHPYHAYRIELRGKEASPSPRVEPCRVVMASKGRLAPSDCVA
jgi:hypothetical protein